MSIKDSSYCIENDRARQFELADIEKQKELNLEVKLQHHIDKEKLYIELYNKLMICRRCHYCMKLTCSKCQNDITDLVNQINNME